MSSPPHGVANREARDYQLGCKYDVRLLDLKVPSALLEDYCLRIPHQFCIFIGPDFPTDSVAIYDRYAVMINLSRNLFFGFYPIFP